MEHLDAALNYYRRALKVKPNFSAAYYNMGLVFGALGQFQSALEHYHQALLFDPENEEARRSLLLLMAFTTLLSPEQTFQEHINGGRRHVPTDRSQLFKHSLRGEYDKRLRIAYVSSDFRDHVASRFFEPVIAAHDVSKVKVFCYA